MDYASILLQTQQLLGELSEGSGTYEDGDYLKAANWAQEQAARLLGLTYVEVNQPVLIESGLWDEIIHEVEIPQDAIKVTRCEIGITTPTPISIAIVPTFAEIPINGTQQFTAIVTGEGSHSVSWAVIGSAGSVDSSGLYTAGGTPGTDTVRVTSIQDSTKHAYATVQVNALPFYTITVTPETVEPTLDHTGAQTNTTAFVVSINHFNGHTAHVDLQFPAGALGGTNLSTTWNGSATTGTDTFAPQGVDGSNTFEITGTWAGWRLWTENGTGPWTEPQQITGNDGVNQETSNAFQVIFPGTETTVTITSPL